MLVQSKENMEVPIAIPMKLRMFNWYLDEHFKFITTKNHLKPVEIPLKTTKILYQNGCDFKINLNPSMITHKI